MTTGVEVTLAPGRYTLQRPLTLTPNDSHIHYTAPTPGAAVVSGGVRLAGWTPSTRFPGTAANASAGTCPSAGTASTTCGYSLSPQRDCEMRGCCWTEGGLTPSGSWCNFRLDLPRRQAWETDLTGVPNAQARHLYVNGRRALRPRLSNPDIAFSDTKLSPAGILTNAAIVANWTAEAELIWPQTTSPWTEPRCTVDNVTQVG